MMIISYFMLKLYVNYNAKSIKKFIIANFFYYEIIILVLRITKITNNLKRRRLK